jgi:hypothetical protein
MYLEKKGTLGRIFGCAWNPPRFVGQCIRMRPTAGAR